MRSGQLSFMKQHPLQCCAIFSVHRSCESNLQISNLLQTPIISWIAHIFVIVIQGGVSKQVIKRTWNLIHKYRTTIYFDGWDNVAWHPLLNIMIACPSGNVFIGSINTIREQKDAQYICNAFAEYIKTIRVDNICRNPSFGLTTKAKGVVRLQAKRKPGS